MKFSGIKQSEGVIIMQMSTIADGRTTPIVKTGEGRVEMRPDYLG